MSERALVHHAKLASDAMLGKLLEILVDDKAIALAHANRPLLVDRNASIEQVRHTLEGAGEGGLLADATATAKRSLERLLLRHGDDGFLEHVLLQVEADEHGNDATVEETFFIPPAPGAFSTARRVPIKELASRVQDRRLYKLCARSAKSGLSAARTLHKEHGSPEARRRLERGAAHFAGLEHSWDVILWIPDPRMRLKPAEVLIDDGHLIRQLQDYDKHGARRGEEIYDAHQRLWAISVFVPKSVATNQRLVDPLLAWLSASLGGIDWDGWGLHTVQEIVAREVRGGLPYAAEVTLRGLISQEAAFIEGTEKLRTDASETPTFESLCEIGRRVQEAYASDAGVSGLSAPRSTPEQATGAGKGTTGTAQIALEDVLPTEMEGLIEPSPEGQAAESS